MVSDANGRAVPKATVTVSGPNLISAQTAQTNDTGHYEILNLPPGRYTVLVAATAGFAETKKDNVEVNLSKTSTADVKVEISKVGGEVTITDTSGAAGDVAGNTTGSNISSEQFSNFPTPHPVQAPHGTTPTFPSAG